MNFFPSSFLFPFHVFWPNVLSLRSLGGCHLPSLGLFNLKSHLYKRKRYKVPLCPLEGTHVKCHTVKSLEHSFEMSFVIFWECQSFVQDCDLSTLWTSHTVNIVGICTSTYMRKTKDATGMSGSSFNSRADPSRPGWRGTFTDFLCIRSLMQLVYSKLFKCLWWCFRLFFWGEKDKGTWRRTSYFLDLLGLQTCISIF